MIANRVAVLKLDNSYFFNYFDQLFQQGIQMVHYDTSFIKEPKESWWAEPRESTCVNLKSWKEEVRYLGVVRK